MAPETDATLRALSDALIGFLHKAAVGEVVCVDDATAACDLFEKLVECLANDMGALSDDQIVAEAVRSYGTAEAAVAATQKAKEAVWRAVIYNYRDEAMTVREATIQACLKACRGARNVVDVEARISKLLENRG